MGGERRPRKLVLAAIRHACLVSLWPHMSGSGFGREWLARVLGNGTGRELGMSGVTSW